MNLAARRFLALLAIAAPIGAAVVARRDGGVWPERPALHVRRTGAFADPRMVESSGVVRGRINPSVLWTLNDSGNEPLLFAVDTTGATRAVLRPPDLPNVDWEALGAGPCGERWCLYVGDVGDNRGVRRSIAIYRILEPVLDGSGGEIAASVLDRQAAHYPDGPHDAEAIVVAGDRDVYVLTKGRDGWAGAYHLPPTRWGLSVAALDSVGRLPIRVGFLVGSLVTDAALSADGGWLAVRTYGTVYLFDRTPGASGLPARPRAACPIRGLEPIGEGIAWWDEATLFLTSERGMGRSPAPITALECPVP